jgi:TIR domain
VKDGIPTYLSHSYRREDQDINLAFWPIFEKAGFYFSVDPPSNITTTAHLEQMMNACSCYVAIVNRRPEIPTYYCSPFILYEFGLAVQARRPMLLLVDDKIGRASPQFKQLDDRSTVFFKANDPMACERELRQKIKELKARALPMIVRAGRRPIGVLLSNGAESKGYGQTNTFSLLEKAAARSLFRCERVTVPMQHNSYLSLQLDTYEAVILDVRGDLLPEWVFAYVHGRLIPSLKLVHVKRSEVPANVALPPLVAGLRMDDDEPGVESVIYWREADDLLDQLTQAFQKLDEEPTKLTKPKEGQIYFNAIGRAPARVFISNHGKVNHLARRLSDTLGLNSIERFQYKDTDAIKTGSEWPAKIKQELQDCQLFVALLSTGYWDSEWCRREMKTALERRRDGTLRVLPYNVDRSDVSFMRDVQVTDLPSDAGRAAQQIFQAIDKALKDDTARESRETRAPMLPGASLEAVVDALRHFPAAQWKTLLNRLRAQKVVVNVDLESRRPQSRRTVEQLLNQVQRMPTPPGGRLPLGVLMEQAAALAPPKWKPSVKIARSRLPH